MAVDGTWKMTIETDEIDPEIVPREATMTLTTDGKEVSGSMQGPYPMGEGVVVAAGTLEGDAIAWTAADARRAPPAPGAPVHRDGERQGDQRGGRGGHLRHRDLQGRPRVTVDSGTSAGRRNGATWGYLESNQGPHPYQGCALTG